MVAYIEGSAVISTGGASSAAELGAMVPAAATVTTAADEAPIAAAAKKTGPESLRGFSQLDSMAEPGAAAPAKGEKAPPPAPAAPKESIELQTIDDFEDPASAASRARAISG